MARRGDDNFFDGLSRQLYSAVLSDAFDEVGLRDQAMTPQIPPLDEHLVLAGLARTGLFREIFHEAPNENPYDLGIKIIDDRKPSEMMVFGCGGSGRIAPWGELLTMASHGVARARRSQSSHRRFCRATFVPSVK